MEGVGTVHRKGEDGMPIRCGNGGIHEDIHCVHLDVMVVDNGVEVEQEVVLHFESLLVVVCIL